MASSWRTAGLAASLVTAGIAIGYGAVSGLPATAALAALVALAVGSDLAERASRQRVHAAVRESPREEARLALVTMLAQSPTPLLLAEGEVLSALNGAARHLFGVDDRLPVPPPALAAAAVSGGSVTIPTVVGERSFAIAVSDIAGFGRVLNLVDIAADLRLAEAATTRELLLILSHEIMNSLTPIASLAQTAVELAEDEGVTADLREAIGTIARRSDDLARFSTGYRELARLPPPIRVSVVAQELVDDLRRLFASRWPSASSRLRVTVSPDDLRFTADGGQIAMALSALLQNAGEACAEAATIHPQVDLHMLIMGDQIVVTVSDNGPGIPATLGEAIFKPFFTTRYGGSGVGLSIARQIFRGHGGDLVLERSGSVETKFTGTLPV